MVFTTASCPDVKANYKIKVNASWKSVRVWIVRGELIYANPQSSSKKKSNSMTTEDDFFVCVWTQYKIP